MNAIVSLTPGPNGGLDLPSDAIILFFALLNRNLELTVDGDRLRVCCVDGSKPEFSEAERAQIVKWKAHLVALVNYVPPVIA